MSNYEGQTYTYGQMTEAIDEWHQFFRLQGLQRGDKVALMGKDSAEWAIFFIAGITYGAVIVPILQDFPPADAMQIIDHSESKLLAINANLWSNMRPEGIPLVSRSWTSKRGISSTVRPKLYSSSPMPRLTTRRSTPQVCAPRMSATTIPRMKSSSC